MADTEPQHAATPGTPASDGGGGHRPVLLHPLIESLQPRPGQTVVDGTLGAGGVTAALLERVSPGGRVIAVDRDPEAVARGRERFAGEPVVVVHDDVANLTGILSGLDVDTVDAVTLDLGVSSVQLDDPRRGFSFRHDGPLDMRLDQAGGGLTAADVVNTYPEAELVDILRSYGEERFARGIAAAMVRRRGEHPLARTTELAQLVERAVPRRYWPKRIHPATRTFQALRIEVNGELGSLERALQACITVLRPGGRIGVIAFHSLEDILVKNALNVAAQNCLCPPRQPICTCAHRASLFLLKRKAVKADALETAVNPRARSARLRVAEKLATT
ncbi:MAG TPA: 16S rRNA (cytosine(1402)-N(4))-methyltransferase RsmH [Candidatus Dormibacteraeota bacterium]|nr:16S rRNA (cytosine(1402)-N(4))-methyltransferase RsmH [Candidatus Dormibacteraeota bacterium]